MKPSKHVSRRHFLSSVASSTAAGVLAHPALSFAGGRHLPGFFDIGTAASLAWQDQGVINTATSPYAKLHSVPVRAVTIEDGFWSKRRKTNVQRSIPSMREQLEEHGRMDNFRPIGGKEFRAPERPLLF